MTTLIRSFIPDAPTPAMNLPAMASHIENAVPLQRKSGILREPICLTLYVRDSTSERKNEVRYQQYASVAVYNTESPVLESSESVGKRPSTARQPTKGRAVPYPRPYAVMSHGPKEARWKLDPISSWVVKTNVSSAAARNTPARYLS